MGLSVEKIEVLLLVAAVVAMLARRLHVPYSVGLVVAGVWASAPALLTHSDAAGSRALKSRRIVYRHGKRNRKPKNI
jgi:predicted Kef-type K+ transport protein